MRENMGGILTNVIENFLMKYNKIMILRTDYSDHKMGNYVEYTYFFYCKNFKMVSLYNSRKLQRIHICLTDF